MKFPRLLLAVTFLLITSLACAQETPTKDDGEGEEKGTKMKIDEKFDEVRRGVRMVLTYDKNSSAFIGTVENITEKIIEKVRVEVHLSNGIELGPTKALDLKPSEKSKIYLSAKGQEFKTWNTHAESGSFEAGHGTEREAHEGENSEHGGEKRERKGEHEKEKSEHNSEQGEH